mmetsp:Transcript_6515/g.19773  ORF Transcript_6515/g.19773 Transcript_6515/m.19773 type:complete len:215 (-) Transcript_6515:379-1023(-)
MRGRNPTPRENRRSPPCGRRFPGGRRLRHLVVVANSDRLREDGSSNYRGPPWRRTKAVQFLDPCVPPNPGRQRLELGSMRHLGVPALFPHFSPLYCPGTIETPYKDPVRFVPLVQKGSAWPAPSQLLCRASSRGFLHPLLRNFLSSAATSWRRLRVRKRTVQPDGSPPYWRGMVGWTRWSREIPEPVQAYPRESCTCTACPQVRVQPAATYFVD